MSRYREARNIDADAPLSSLARHSVEDAVDLVWASTAQEVGEAEVAQALAALAHRASDRMPELESDPALTQAVDDEEWINALAGRLEEAAPESADELDEVEAFGGGAVWDRLSEAVIRVRGAAGRLGGGAAAKLLRADIHRQAALFLGDVFFYLDRRGDRGHPGPIVDQVVQTLESAVEAGPPLVVVAHSMGGGIVYDVLSYYRPDIRVQMLVTVGSQVGLFEELCLLQLANRRDAPRGRHGSLSSTTSKSGSTSLIATICSDSPQSGSSKVSRTLATRPARGCLLRIRRISRCPASIVGLPRGLGSGNDAHSS